jgi:hypothetical protein
MSDQNTEFDKLVDQLKTAVVIAASHPGSTALKIAFVMLMAWIAILLVLASAVLVCVNVPGHYTVAVLCWVIALAIVWLNAQIKIFRR